MSTESALNRAQIQRLIAIRAYWTEKRGNRAMPRRADIDPTELRSLLPNVLLLQVLRDPLDFLYRVIGTEIDRHSQASYTGLTVRQIPHRAPPSRVWENLEQLVRTGVPSCLQVPYIGPHSGFLQTRQILLPLGDDGAEVDHILGAIVYLRRGSSDRGG